MNELTACDDTDAELEPWHGGGRPASAAQEAEDERHDEEMLAAIKASMRQWEMKKGRTRSVPTI